MSVNSSNSARGASSGFDFLFSDIQYLKGVGPKKGDVLRNHGISTVFDIFYYIPRRYLDRSQITPIDSLMENTNATIIGTISAFGMVRGRRNRFEAIIEDKTGQIALVWFKGFKYILSAFEIGDVVCVSGPVKVYGRLYFPHPDFEVVGSVDDETIHTGRLIPVYPGSAELKEIGLNSRGFRRIIKPALDKLAENPCETIPQKWRQEYGLSDLTRAISQVHFPDTLEMADHGRQRLAFEELFYLELIMAGRQKQRKNKQNGIILGPPLKTGRKLLDSLGFKLTKAQVRVLNEIYADMKSPFQMNRLIQGDVGSGKTIVAVLAMLGAIEAGFQVAVMAPTEILAEQHYYSISEFLKPLDISVVLLTGSVTGKNRKPVLESVANGISQVIIGTHALIESKVNFANLGFVVIDEQHRFGVVQRARLQSKGKNPDILVMTATPIPRTLAMTIYGDLDVSVIDEMPPGRLPIETRYFDEEERHAMYDFIHSKAREGQSAFFVFPLVEETEKSDLKAATQGYEKLSEIFPDLKLGLLHGRMSSNEKVAVMMAFKNKEISILVATTIVEVGLDVQSATIMVIEHSERFGLSQLHQLRGRVGRAKEKSYCFLLTGERRGEDAQRRIDAIIATSDGFKIAEVDLEIRGPGEVLGTRQHGMPDLRVARLTDTSLVTLARRLAFEMVDDDPGLNKPENLEIKTILKKRLGGKLRYAKIG